MKVIDPGHEYALDSLDGEFPQTLTFVKREGAKYPGNVGSHPGTTTQEVLRAIIDRSRYVNQQMPCDETTEVIDLLVRSLVVLEQRAARLHGRVLTASTLEVVTGEGKCSKCGHVGCEGHNLEAALCRAVREQANE